MEIRIIPRKNEDVANQFLLSYEGENAQIENHEKKGPPVVHW